MQVNNNFYKSEVEIIILLINIMRIMYQHTSLHNYALFIMYYVNKY